ncbi:MAG: hypothetical protein JJLCMIEE_01696 [Acidimicrobiales bacterium]|nr:hypothetical protein [Acidimicrobiales bacterium]
MTGVGTKAVVTPEPAPQRVQGPRREVDGRPAVRAQSVMMDVDCEVVGDRLVTEPCHGDQPGFSEGVERSVDGREVDRRVLSLDPTSEVLR